jgi:MerR family transcriptional regulator, repressor of the yfmOP operon
MTATATALRIGELAERAGTTPRTVRYYEEIGLLEPREDRGAGQHRTYSEADLERLQEVLRLKELLGLSLDELKEVVAAEDARAALRAEWQAEPAPGRRTEILTEALEHLDTQLTLLRRRREALRALEDDLTTRRTQVTEKLRALEGEAGR